MELRSLEASPGLCCERCGAIVYRFRDWRKWSACSSLCWERKETMSS